MQYGYVNDNNDPFLNNFYTSTYIELQEKLEK